MPPHMLNGYSSVLQQNTAQQGTSGEQQPSHRNSQSTSSQFFNRPSSRQRIGRHSHGNRTSTEFQMPQNEQIAIDAGTSNNLHYNPFARQQSTISNQQSSHGKDEDLISNATPNWNRQQSCAGEQQLPTMQISNKNFLDPLSGILSRAQSMNENDLVDHHHVEVHASHLARIPS